MARTGTSKGQLFHYFPAGKDELLVAVAQFEADQVLETSSRIWDASTHGRPGSSGGTW